MRKDIIQVIVAILVIVGMAFTASAYFAKESEVRFVQSSQQLHFLSHAIQEVQSQMWQIESKYGTKDCFKFPPRDRDTYRKLLEKLEKLKKKENVLIQRTTRGG